jgi:hypothetical protein
VGEADDGYGDLNDQLTPSRPLRWVGGAAAALAAVGLITYLALGRTDDGQADGAATNPSVTTTAAVTTSEPDMTTTTSAAPALTVGEDELPQYITEPIFYGPGTVEAEVEVAFVNAEVASLRALAQPSVIEPEVEQYQIGFALKATEDSRQILLEDGQIIQPTSLSRIEIENVSLVSDTEADIEVCFLEHSFSIVVDDPTDQIESLGTLHSVQRMVRNTEGQWQLSELLTIIQDVEGFGACLDANLTPVDPDEVPGVPDIDPGDTTG